MCERICEERRRDGLHGLAIQYGPIGDVGVFADSSDQLLMLSSLRNQRTNSCFNVLDKLLAIKQTIVTSHVKVEVNKELTGDRGKSIVNILWRSLGIDPNNTPNDLTLGEIGIESMFAVELQQEFEREWNQNYDAGNMVDIKKHIDHVKKAKDRFLKNNFLIPSETHVQLNNVRYGVPVYFMPPLLVSFAGMEELANRINRPVIGINWTRELSEMTTLKDINQYYANLLKTLEPSGKYDVVGYFDTTIACVKLVLKGMKGKAILVDAIESESLSDTDILLKICHKRIMSDVRAKVKYIVNEMIEFAGKGLVATDMEQILQKIF
ncbi:unnamed protein product, partial [Medioppia subpectinata]